VGERTGMEVGHLNGRNQSGAHGQKEGNQKKKERH